MKQMGRGLFEAAFQARFVLFVFRRRERENDGSEENDRCEIRKANDGEVEVHGVHGGLLAVGTW